MVTETLHCMYKLPTDIMGTAIQYLISIIWSLLCAVNINVEKWRQIIASLTKIVLLYSKNIFFVFCNFPILSILYNWVIIIMKLNTVQLQLHDLVPPAGNSQYFYVIYGCVSVQQHESLTSGYLLFVELAPGTTAAGSPERLSMTLKLQTHAGSGDHEGGRRARTDDGSLESATKWRSLEKQSTMVRITVIPLEGVIQWLSPELCGTADSMEWRKAEVSLVDAGCRASLECIQGSDELSSIQKRYSRRAGKRQTPGRQARGEACAQARTCGRTGPGTEMFGRGVIGSGSHWVPVGRMAAGPSSERAGECNLDRASSFIFLDPGW